ncbi:MFS transporter, partial [Candidatus Bathyarchaeota archaeon]|nr:MFS transporter [Candidatus Bathyarchaeota archaeon]
MTWGILIQYFIQYGAAEGTDGGPTDPNQGEAAFRIPWGVQAVPGLILFILMFFCPYSPRWLASRDRFDECLTVLANIHGKGDVNNAKVQAEFLEIK